MTVIGELIESMMVGRTEQEILDFAVARLVELVGVSGAGVTLVGADGVPRFVAASDPIALRFEELQTQFAEGPCVVAHGSGSACTIPDLAADRRFAQFGPAALAQGMAAVFARPLRSPDRALGAVDLYRDRPGPLSSDEFAGARVLTEMVAAFLINTQSRDALETFARHLQGVAYHDPLTGLANRILLTERLEQALRRQARSERTVAVLFVDLDDFKSVNDCYGHRVGDALLLALAHRLTAVLRPSDTLARFGGDEFVIVCEDFEDPEQVDLFRDRIKDQFASGFDLAGQSIHMRVSVGTAFAQAPDQSAEALLSDADCAMYVDKRRPR